MVEIGGHSGPRAHSDNEDNVEDLGAAVHPQHALPTLENKSKEAAPIVLDKNTPRERL